MPVPRPGEVINFRSYMIEEVGPRSTHKPANSHKRYFSCENVTWFMRQDYGGRSRKLHWQSRGCYSGLPEHKLADLTLQVETAVGGKLPCPVHVDEPPLDRVFSGGQMRYDLRQLWFLRRPTLKKSWIAPMNGARLALVQTNANLTDFAVSIHGTRLATKALIEYLGTEDAVIITEGCCDKLEIIYQPRFIQCGRSIAKPDWLPMRMIGSGLAGGTLCEGVRYVAPPPSHLQKHDLAPPKPELGSGVSSQAPLI